MYALTDYGRYGAPIRVELARIGVQFVQGNPVNEGQVGIHRPGALCISKYLDKDHSRQHGHDGRWADRHTRAWTLHFTACATAAQVQMQMTLADDGTVLVHWTKSRTGPIQLVERALRTAAYGASSIRQCGAADQATRAVQLPTRVLWVCFASIACSFRARIGGADGWRTMVRP